jgi:hypothetical protein
MENNNARDLLDLLEVNRDRIPHKSLQAVRYLQRRWEECGCPAKPAPLQEILDKAINFCPSVGLIYPKVILLRLKQMQRGEWAPPSP